MERLPLVTSQPTSTSGDVLVVIMMFTFWLLSPQPPHPPTYAHIGILVLILVQLHSVLSVELKKAMMPPTQISRCTLVGLLLQRWDVVVVWTHTFTSHLSHGRRVKGESDTVISYTRILLRVCLVFGLKLFLWRGWEVPSISPNLVWKEKSNNTYYCAYIILNWSCLFKKGNVWKWEKIPRPLPLM